MRFYSYSANNFHLLVKCKRYSSEKGECSSSGSGTGFGAEKTPGSGTLYRVGKILAQVPDLDTDLGDCNSGPRTGYGAGKVQL
jgi:hypothetical protein